MITSIQDYSNYYQKWNWEWFATLTFNYDNPNPQSIKKLRLDWTRKLCTLENIQVAYFYVETYIQQHPHLHLLMIGRNNENKTLLDINPTEYELMWPYLAKIEIPRSETAVTNYFTKNLLSPNAEWDIYNQYLLKKTMN